MAQAQFILKSGKITTLNKQQPEVQAIAIADGKVLRTGSNEDVMKLAQADTKIIDLNGRRVIPGLNDSHLHLIRGGLNYNMELRWEGVPSLSDAMRLLKEQADNTPAPQWVRVIGGWSEFQFAEKRLPTLDEINKAAPDTPVFVLHLYASAMLNRAALKALGFDKNTPNPPGGQIQRDAKGEPTGLLLATPSAMILYSTLGMAPKLELEDQVNSTRHFMRELNRLGLSVPVMPDGAFYAWADCTQAAQRLGVPSGKNCSWDFAFELMRRAHIAVTPGRDFGTAEPERFIRFSTANSMAQLQESVERLRKLLG